MDIREVLFILKKHWKLLAVLSVVCGLSGFMLSRYVIAPKYESDATLVVNAGQTAQSTVVTYDQLSTAQQLVNTCAVILKSDTVLDQVIQNLNLDMTSKQLEKNVTINGINQTEVLDISVKATDPQVAAYIANEISKLAPDMLIKTVKASSVEVISPAKANHMPVSPKIPLYTAAAFLFGLVAAVISAFLIELLDNSFTTEEDVQKYLGLSVLGVIPNVESK